MSTDPLLKATEAAKRHHASLKPFFASAEPLRLAARKMTVDRAKPAQTMVSPHDTDRDLRFMVEGSAVVTARVAEGKPESLRTLNPPSTFGAVPFSTGTARDVSVVAMRSTTCLRITPKNFRALAKDSPTVAVGLLRWACLDLIDWLRDSRMGNDAWSKRNAMRGDPDRSFRSEPHARDVVPVESDTQAAVLETLSDVPFLKGSSLLPLVDALGDKVHLIVVAANQPALTHNERDGSLYILLEGRASVLGRNDAVLATFKAGGQAHEVLLGEVAFLAQGGRSGTVVADTDCVLLEIPRAAVGWMLLKHGALAVALHLGLLRTLCWRMREMDGVRESFVTGGHRIR